ncbi:MAG: primosomal protein N' [Planctomycetota bacterium]|nr:primosomal protein N' [Planctomycetota bacterium]
MSEPSLFGISGLTPQRGVNPASNTYLLVVPERGIEHVGGQGPAPRVRTGTPEPGSQASRARVPQGKPSRGDSLVYRWTGPGLPVVGERILVPLGKGDRGVGAIVLASGGVELAGGLSPHRIKDAHERTPGGLTPSLVELARWIAEYTICPLGMVVASMTPAAVKQGVGRQVVSMIALGDARPGPDLVLKPAADAAARAITSWERDAWPMTPTDARARLVQELGPAAPRVLPGLLRSGVLKLVRVERVRARDDWAEDANQLEEAEPISLGPGTERIQNDVAPKLTHAQASVVEGIGASLGGFGVHLVRGVTGSGKTEVYLHLIERVIAAERTAIVLVPEIALTPQTSRRFLQRLGRESVAVLHSGLTPAQRHTEWARAAEGRVRVVVGARSAVFAPLRSLGLIVVDEEHDGSYKQDQLPRYGGRDVAIRRGQIENCPVVLGSATPSLESWANATMPSAGGGPPRFKLWELRERVGRAKLPMVRVVDLNLERLEQMRRRPTERLPRAVGPTLEDALARTLDAGGQAILLLNKRGFASLLACPSANCGWKLNCQNCDAMMVLHRNASLPQGELVACHHCTARTLAPALCPACGRKLISLGTGTQRLEDELVRTFGISHGLAEGKTLVRVDSDAMQSFRAYAGVLARFERGEVRVLVGTQMVAKGLDFPNVRLVGVVQADMALTIPDFRAAERTFQLVSQVAGRAGRGEHPGLVLVQTYDPRHPAILLAADHDYEGFAAGELAVRQRAKLPPVSRMARIVCRDEDLEKASRRAEELGTALRQFRGDMTRGEQQRGPIELRVEGPSLCPLARVANQHRVGLEVIAPDAQSLHRALTALRDAGMLRSDAKTAVDVDPVALM